MVEAIVFVASIIFLVVDYYVAKAFQEIAEMKGYSDSKYFWYCFWLGFVGYLMVIALPMDAAASAEASEKAERFDNDELPEI